MPDPANARVLAGIDSRTWEHPADRAALNALRKIPGFDQVLKTLFGLFGEKPIRLAFQANAVRVSPTQFARVHRLTQEVYRVLDAEHDYPVFVQQEPHLNAFAYGMERPFVILNSALVSRLDDDELRFVLGHELGHVMSGHALYNTMLRILVAVANMGIPLLGLAATPVLMALMEWSRKAELSCDRAGILAVQDPEPGMRTMLKFAGGEGLPAANLPDFVRQADEYRQTGDAADQVFKVLNLLGATHPFPVIRVAEMRGWFESGAYERIVGGDYRRRGEPDPAYREDVSAAAQSYREGAKETFGQASEAAKRVVDSFKAGFNRR
ncbi:MAG TPA: M48 family metallopeptidase [Longimicrobiaceae bacterium]|jgi:Zn-dependent protease with chaperone function|nr:M48 family metallopeptidase [Longimicrobiaceae bacterium]